MRLNCPHCGLRDSDEFSYEGDATRRFPGLDNPDPDAWHDYVFLRANPRGRHQEYWRHLHGCRGFLRLVRDTQSHEIIETTSVGSWADAEKPGAG